jgi:hypothetical protein
MLERLTLLARLQTMLVRELLAVLERERLVEQVSGLGQATLVGLVPSVADHHPRAKALRFWPKHDMSLVALDWWLENQPGRYESLFRRRQ